LLADPAALEAAISLQILSPQIPLLFMGEEDASRTPFYFFSDYRGALADAVREGRRREFARFATFADPTRRDAIPDPNAASTFEASVPRPDPAHRPARREFYRRLLAVRSIEIVPRLAGVRSLRAFAIGSAAVKAAWRLGDGSVLTIAVNLGPERIETGGAASGRVLFESVDGAGEYARSGMLGPRSTVAFLQEQA
jgi:maltooligosyltrehalose trehalohydrolase